MNIAPAKLLDLICTRIVGRGDSVSPRNYAIGALTTVIGEAVNDPGRTLTEAEIERAIAEVLKRHQPQPVPAELAALFPAPEDDTRYINTAEGALRELGEYAA